MVTSALRANEHIVQISKSSVVHVRLFEAGSRRQRDALTKEWMLLGEALGLFLSSSQDDLKPCWDFRTVEVWWKTAGCFWPGCICAGSKPYHKMRVCRVCLRAVYCSERCQSKYAYLLFCSLLYCMHVPQGLANAQTILQCSAPTCAGARIYQLTSMSCHPRCHSREPIVDSMRCQT